MTNADLADVAAYMGERELAETILAADDPETLQLAARGLLAIAGRQLQAIGAALAARGDRVGGAKTQARGRSVEAAARWEAE